jgi:hypothetical protein
MERVEKLLKLDANTNGMPASTAGKSLQNVK